MKFQATLRTFIIRDIVKIQVALANIEICNSVPLSWVERTSGNITNVKLSFISRDPIDARMVDFMICYSEAFYNPIKSGSINSVGQVCYAGLFLST